MWGPSYVLQVFSFSGNCGRSLKKCCRLRSGLAPTIKYNFFANLFKIGFVVLWILYLYERKLVNTRLLIFVLPALLMLLSAAFIRGRRAEMMNLCSYILVALWLVRRITLPRWADDKRADLGTDSGKWNWDLPLHYDEQRRSSERTSC